MIAMLMKLLRCLLPVICAMFVAAPGHASSPTSELFVRPAELEPAVAFWRRVYTEVTTQGGLIHDPVDLSVVYEVIDVPSNLSPKQRSNYINEKKKKYARILDRLASGATDLTAEEQRVQALWPKGTKRSRFEQAAEEVRFQLGQADRFLEGLIRAGAWEAHIAEVFANRGLPNELAALPHVESSFNPNAYSKVGAAGLWQFMRSTGRRYMRIDASVDDRLDPYRSTEAAAQLLSYNYRLLGTWPLALTAYNHGAAGMRRAKEAMGTDDIEYIVRNYKSKTFGFASRNFYVSFLAALEIDRNPEKYFGPFTPMAEVKFQEVAVPSYVPIASLQRALNIDMKTLRELNPALRPLVWNGQRNVPKGYRLRLPHGGETWTTELLAQRLGPTEQYASQTVEQQHRIQPGETLSTIAARYGTTVQVLADLNGIRPTDPIRAGRTLVLPSAQGPTVAAAAATRAASSAEAIPAALTTTDLPEGSVYVVRRGDSIYEIAKKTGLKESEILRLNRLRNPNYIYEGQKLVLTAPPTEEAATPVPTRTRAEAVAASLASRGRTTRPVTQGPRPTIQLASLPGAAEGVGPAEAQRESEEDAKAVERAGAPAQDAQPVSAAQAEALGPALGPAIEVPQTADPIDYSVDKDGTIAVVAEETLGHYAEWLGITASRLRQVNSIKYGRPVLIGQRLKLDFSKVTPEAFEQTRREYHRALQARYFATHRIVGTEVYIVRRGDSLWTVTQKFSRLPMWLLQQYNPDVDFSEMRAGTEIVVPRVEELTANG